MPTPTRPIREHVTPSIPAASSPFTPSYLSRSPIAEESIARDLANDNENDVAAAATENPSLEESSDDTSLTSDSLEHSMVSSCRRPSSVILGLARPAITPNLADRFLAKGARKQARDEERILSRDNRLAPPQHAESPRRSDVSKLHGKVLNTKRPRVDPDEEAPLFTSELSETLPLLPDLPQDSVRAMRERLNTQWEEAVAAGKIKTSWQREAKILWRNSVPLIVTFVLQYSLPVASIFAVSHLGKVELGAVSLASMTATITGYAIYQGLATSLDTLCAQAYGNGKSHLVGLQLQRMVYFLWVLTIPIGIIWLTAEKILEQIVPEKESAQFAGLYLRILLIGAPGYAAFESGKRFVQAQGLFSATTYVLLFTAPLNALLNWLFVWQFEWGFVGAPIAVVVTDNLLPFLLFLYVRFVDGRQCWNGFTRKAFRNWGPMIKLALPGLLMVEAGYLAFEILTLASSHFSTTHLAAQSILGTITTLTFQIPFSLSIAASTRVANLIGATLSDAAKVSGKAAAVGALCIGAFNVILLSSLRTYIPELFTSDQGVIDLVTRTLPICAAFQLFDALAASCSGLLRGLGRQEIGGWVNLFCYYVIAMPISFGMAFGLGWELRGLWTGIAIGLGLVAVFEALIISRMNWSKAVEAAQDRNNAG